MLPPGTKVHVYKHAEGASRDVPDSHLGEISFTGEVIGCGFIERPFTAQLTTVNIVLLPEHLRYNDQLGSYVDNVVVSTDYVRAII